MKNEVTTYEQQKINRLSFKGKLSHPHNSCGWDD